MLLQTENAQCICFFESFFQLLYCDVKNFASGRQVGILFV